MSHIHTKPGQHDLTVSFYIVKFDKDQPRIMLHRHKKYGVYMQFGGHVELNENPWQAMSRELKEETGYDINQLKIIQPRLRMKKSTGVTLHPMPVSFNTHSIPGNHFHTDVAYVFTTTQDPAHKLKADESSDIRLFTKQELKNLATDQTYENNREVALFVLNHLLKDWEEISTSHFKG